MERPLVIAHDFEDQLQHGLINGTLGYLIKDYGSSVVVERYDNGALVVWRYAQPTTIEQCKKAGLI